MFLLYSSLNSVVCGICSIIIALFLVWSERVYPMVLLMKHISAYISQFSSPLTDHDSLHDVMLV